MRRVGILGLVGWTLLAAHVASIVFSVSGMVIALRYPELWADSAAATWVFSLGMRWGAPGQILLGAGAVLLLGAATLGWRRVAIFFALAVAVSLAAELVGTTTGWPFGAYRYGDALGPKLLGRVPYAIPLSWFYLGLASYVLASYLVARAGLGRRTAATVLLGAWLVTVWDLVLDPAMAHPAMPMKFWTWHEEGAYFGMPLRNFVGWGMTAATFMGLARAAWGDVEIGGGTLRWAVAVYGSNLAFAALLDAGTGLWGPIVFAVAGVSAPVLAFHRRPAVGPLGSRRLSRA
jgi:putative membrane protein